VSAVDAHLAFDRVHRPATNFAARQCHSSNRINSGGVSSSVPRKSTIPEIAKAAILWSLTSGQAGIVADRKRVYMEWAEIYFGSLGHPLADEQVIFWRA
jgi:hypothetical protein